MYVRELACMVCWLILSLSGVYVQLISTLIDVSECLCYGTEFVLARPPAGTITLSTAPLRSATSPVYFFIVTLFIDP